MFLLVLADGSARALPRVAEVRNEGNELLCFDDTGAIVERYTAQDVLIYGDEAKIAPLIAESRTGQAVVQKMSADGAGDQCCAADCATTAAVVFTFESTRGGLKLGLCRTHEDLVDDEARKIVLNKLDLRRVTISVAGQPLASI
jgi:hypothetical protein